MLEQAAQNPTKTFFWTGATALLPLLTLAVVGRQTLTKILGFNGWEIFTITSAYLGLFGGLTLLAALGYFLKAKNGGQTNDGKSRWHFGLTLASMGIFVFGALIAQKIGQRLFGGFVALSLILMLVALFVLIANLLTPKSDFFETDSDVND